MREREILKLKKSQRMALCGILNGKLAEAGIASMTSRAPDDGYAMEFHEAMGRYNEIIGALGTLGIEIDGHHPGGYE